MKRKHFLIYATIVFALVSWVLFVTLWHTSPPPPGPGPFLVEGPSRPSLPQAPTVSKRNVVMPVQLPSLPTAITTGNIYVVRESAKVFEYAHSTVEADGKIFVGMAGTSDNPFASNELIIFNSIDSIAHPTLLSLPLNGDVETMVYDNVNDRVYFALTSTSTFGIFELNPHTNALSLLLATSSFSLGKRPAIVTDGSYIYGITNTDPSVVFKINLQGGVLALSSTGHIPNGHAAAIGIYASTTELYFTGGSANGFEKVNAATLQPIASEVITPCTMSDDMPFVETSAQGGYVYVGCEIVPYGLRINTATLAYDRFRLPGASWGIFVIGNDIYNTAQDGMIDVFPGSNLRDLHRYTILNTLSSFDTKGQPVEPNELIYAPENNSLFMTAWYGTKGMYELSTSTVNVTDASSTTSTASTTALH